MRRIRLAATVLAYLAVAGTCNVLAQPLSPAHSAAPAGCLPSEGPGIPPPPIVATGIPGLHASWFGQSGYPTLCPGGRSTALLPDGPG